MSLLKHIAGYLLPVLVILGAWKLVGDWGVDGDSWLRVSGTAGLALFGVIFIIGPLPRFWSDLSPWKIFRPYWAKWAVLLITLHLILVYVVIYQFNFVAMFSRANPQLLGLSLGLAAFLYFVFMVVISEHSIRAKLGPHWKQLHTAGYLAFALALLHFWLMNLSDGEFSLEHFAEQALFVFAIIVLVLRGYVFIWAHFDSNK